MFIWDFLASNVLDQILDWLYAKLVDAFGQFFAEMNGMGSELFGYSWTQAIVLFFSRLGWALYTVGIAVALFEYALEAQSGRGDLKRLGMDCIRGFLAVSLFSAVPVELYKVCVSLQSSMSDSITRLMGFTPEGIAGTAITALGLMPENSSIFLIFLLLALGYCVGKVFFANLKRGGILLIQIAVGSLYMFSIPRGYIDGFTGWSKQIIGLCLTTFLQSTILIAGLMLFQDNQLLGVGLMLSATEVPRICGAFGLDTSTRANVMGAVHATQTIVSTVRTVSGLVAK